MTTQYGFFIDSSRCTGCKTCELACKDYKDLTPDVSFRRIYEYAGGDWQEDNGGTSVTTGLWWWMKMSASAVATATWPVRTVPRSTTPPKGI